MQASELGHRNGPPVSVIVIFLNEARFLQEAVTSVFAQTYVNWELLLVDDGSTDGSTDLARGYAERYPDRVRYVAHPGNTNKGMSATRNLGIAHARGEYLAFLDADDVWMPDRLLNQVKVLEADPRAAMIFGRTQWWYSWSGLPEDSNRDFVHELGVRPGQLIDPPSFLPLFLGNEGLSPCTCSVLIRKGAVEAVGGFEERFRGMYEDQAFFAKLAAQFPIIAVDDCASRYRQHADSACSITVRNGGLSDARREFLGWLQDYLRMNQVRDEQVWRSLRAAQWSIQHPLLDRVFAHTKQVAMQLKGS